MSESHKPDDVIRHITEDLNWLKKDNGEKNLEDIHILRPKKISKKRYYGKYPLVMNRLKNSYLGYHSFSQSDGCKLNGKKDFQKRSILRRLVGRRKATRTSQIKLLEKCKHQCESWKKKNKDWAKVLKRFNKKQRGKSKEVKGPHQSGLRVGHVNICSLTTTTKKDKVPYKFLNLQSYLKAFKFDVFVIGESQVIGIDDCELKIPGYEIKRLDREFTGNPPVDKVDGGGILVYVRSGRVKVEEVVLRNVLGSNLLQYIDLKLKYNKKTLHVVAVYNPPETGKMNAMLRANNQKKVFGGLLYDYRLEQDVVVLGDINIDILGGINQPYQHCFGKLGFQQCIKEVTRWHSQTLIDHIYFKAENWNVSESGVFPSGPQKQIEGFADHKIIYCTLV